MDNVNKFVSRLEKLAESHAKKGIKSCEYGVVGEVMFWSLRKVLGKSYTHGIHTAWVKIFSSMLKIIVPLSIEHELKSNAAQLKRISEFEEYCVSDCKKTVRMAPNNKSLSRLVSTKSTMIFSTSPTRVCSDENIIQSVEIMGVDDFAQ